MKGVTDACYRLGGGVTSFALLTRVGVSTLVKYATLGERRNDGSHEHGQTIIPIDIAIEADMRAGSPIIIGQAAAELGYELTPKSEALKARTITAHDAHSVLAEAMDVSRAILEAGADGQYDALEKRTICAEAREAIRALQNVINGFEAGRVAIVGEGA
nr:phage regulatory CII family protein [Rhizobium herbae]